MKKAHDPNVLLGDLAYGAVRDAIVSKYESLYRTSLPATKP